MLNREKYGNEIIELAVNTGKLVLKNGEPALCRETKCEECDFGDRYSVSCKGSTYNFREWLNSEYVEPPIDWSKVAVDTPILVKDVKSGEWNRGYFAMYENGTVFTWYHGATSWSAEGDQDIESWSYAKLAESEDV